MPAWIDSEEAYLDVLHEIADEDVAGLRKAQESYGNSWKSRGGVGAFMMLARKWDRMVNRIDNATHGCERWDIFAHIAADPRAEGIIDDVRDLRRYLLLVEAEMRARGINPGHRDNKGEDDGGQTGRLPARSSAPCIRSHGVGEEGR
jgi:hypothetical protein